MDHNEIHRSIATLNLIPYPDEHAQSSSCETSWAKAGYTTVSQQPHIAAHERGVSDKPSQPLLLPVCFSPAMSR